MIRLLTILLLFSCTVQTAPISVPAPIPVVPPKVVFTQVSEVEVSPIAGDNWSYLQSVIDSCIANGINTVKFKKGVYVIGKPLHLENKGRFFSLNLVGEDAVHFTLDSYAPVIRYTGTDGYAIGYQLCRSSVIKGLVITGSGIQQDTRFKPYAGIVIDPFDRANTSGSSGLIIRECAIRGFTVGICNSPNAVTLNSENIHVQDVSISDVRIAYATTHRQQKGNTVKNLICWGAWEKEGITTVFDGVSYGQGAGVIPFIDGVNIAGHVNQVFDFGPQLFATSARSIFAESIFKIGTISMGRYGVKIQDSHFDFEFGKFPPYHFKGIGVVFDNVSIRYYDDKFDKRVIIDGFDNMFLNCHLDQPILCQLSQYQETGRTNYYFNSPVVQQSLLGVVPHKDIEQHEWMDRQYINVEEKHVETSRPVSAKPGDYIVGGQKFQVFGRVERNEGRKIYLTDIPKGTITGFYHIGTNGSSLNR